MISNKLAITLGAYCVPASPPPPRNPPRLLRRSSPADRAGRTRRRLCHSFLLDKEVNVPGRGRAVTEVTGSRRRFIVRRDRRGVTFTPPLYSPLNAAKLAVGWICHHERDAAHASAVLYRRHIRFRPKRYGIVCSGVSVPSAPAVLTRRYFSPLC